MADDKLNQSDIDALIAKVRGGGSSGGKSGNDTSNPLDKLGITENDLKYLKKLFETSIEASTEVLRSITQKNVTVESIDDIKVAGRKELSRKITPPFIATKVDYVVGIKGLDLLLMKQTDLNNLMKLQFESMGFTPDENDTELMMSASNEVMNQMMGNASNKLGNELGIFIDISTPDSQLLAPNEDNPEEYIEIPFLKEDELSYVYTTYKLNVEGNVTGDLVKVLDSNFIEELRTIMSNKEKLNETNPVVDTGENLSSFETSQRHIDQMRQSAPAVEEPQAQPEITQPVQPVQPDQPVQPVQYVQPGQPVQYAQPGQPVQYAQPGQPVQYAQPGQPVQYAQPAQPVQYAQPTPQPVSSNIINDSSVEVKKYELPYLNPMDHVTGQTSSTDRIKSVQVQMTVELGRTKMTVKEILELDKGSIVELDTLAGEHIDLYCNGTLVAKGEVVVIKDNFAFRVLSIVDKDYR